MRRSRSGSVRATARRRSGTDLCCRWRGVNPMYLSGAGGVRIAFDDVGPQESTTTVVLLHGGAQTRHSWGAIPTALSRAGYRSVAIDLRGHGDSDWAPDGDYSPDALVGDVEGVVAYVGGP